MLKNKEFESLVRPKIIKDWDTLVRNIQPAREAGLKVVFTNGCFDLFHAGHASILHKARSFGDVLIVGLNTDESVARLKGTGRPLMQLSARAMLLAALPFVDWVTVFGEDTPARLIETIKPDILVKGADYAGKEVVGSGVVKENGGIVRLVEFEDGFSTSSIIEKIRKSE